MGLTWKTPRTWTAGEKPSAGTYNADIRDQFKAIGDPWTAFTPVWTATTTNPTLGNGTLTGFWMQAGKLTFYSIVLTTGSTTTYGAGSYSFSLPANAVRQMSCGDVRLFDTSGSSNMSGSAFVDTGLSTVRLLHSSGSVTPTQPFTFATGDVIMVAGNYEAA